MKRENIDVSKERKRENNVIRVNDASKGRVSRTTFTERNEVKKSRNNKR